MLAKSLKFIAWTAGSLVGIAVALYLAAFAVNLRDRPPSADAARLTALYETRRTLGDDDNAFIYLLGFDAPLSDDPREVGARRLAWFETSEAPFDRADDPQTRRLEYLSADPVVRQFRTVCGPVNRECASAFSDAGAVFEVWNTAHPWLLERYLALIAHSGWREAVRDIFLPLPNYSAALHGQRLLLLQTKRLADSGDTAAASELLSSDARFWRMVLASSDSVVTKMIAAAALQQHFAWGTLATRELPPGRVAAAIPGEWRQPMTPDELSLRRTIAGEWVYSSKMFAAWSPSPADDEAFAARAAGQLARPLFQPQATLNRHAAYLNELVETLDAPLAGYARATARASQIAGRAADEAFPPRSLYNMVGSLLLASAAPDYGTYARRVADLEGIRRAALAAVTLRDAATPAPEVGAALAASPLRNPYDEQPLHWDADDQAVVFVGLGPGEHRFFR